MVKGVSWEENEGILLDFTEQLFGAIRDGTGDFGFRDYVYETVGAVFDEGYDDVPADDLLDDFFELWASWYTNTRRLQTVDRFNTVGEDGCYPDGCQPHGDDEADYCSGHHCNGGCDV